MHCEQLTIVIRESRYRFVSYCEHGTIHIHWDFVTFHCYFQDFEHLVQLLKRIRTAPAIPSITHEGLYKVIRQENNYCQLWLDEVALLLDPADMLRFAALIINARHLLDDQLSQLSMATLLGEHQIETKVSHYISHN